MTKNVTIKEVAHTAGVSIGSVSNVLNGNSSVKIATETKVRAAMKKLGYRPNASAQSMRTKTTRAIGFVINDISNPIYAEIAKAAENVLNRYGYHLILIDSDNRSGQEVEILSMLNSGRVDAIVITLSDEKDPNVLEALHSTDVPVIMLDRDADFSLNSVNIDYARGVEKAVTYLADLGHQDIALICGSDSIRPGRECISGYKSAIERCYKSVAENLVRSGPLGKEFGYQQTLELLRSRDRPTAIICGGNRIFAGALKAIKQLHIDIPEQLSVIACDDTDLTSFATPSYTVLTRDTQELGEAVAGQVIESLQAGKSRPCNNILLEAELLIRESCARTQKNK
jgi:LacI family transcriptional regulator